MLIPRFSRRALPLLALFSLLTVPAYAQEPPAGPPGQPPAGQPGEPQKPNYGQWWLEAARDVQPKPPGWLFHTEGQGSFANQTGSVSGFEYRTDVLSAQRKGIFTNQVGVSFILQEARTANGNFKQITEKYAEILSFNVTGRVNLVTAAVWEKDEPKHLLRRISVFEGLERNFKMPKGRVLGLGAAIGYEKERSDTQNGPVDEDSPVIYMKNTFSAPIEQRGIFTHYLEMFYDLKNTDDFRMNWNLGLSLQINQHIGIGPSLKINYDSAPVSQVQKWDTLTVFGIQFR